MKKNFGLVAALFSCVAMTSCGGNGTLTVYTESGFAPFEYVDGNEIVGVDVDIMNLVGLKLGKKVVFENVDFDAIIDAVKEGKLTNVGAAGLSITEERKQKVDFSKPYYTANLYCIYNTNNFSNTHVMTDGNEGIYWSALGRTETNKTKIGIQTGTTADFFLSDELEEGASLYNVAQKTDFTSLLTAVEDIGVNTDFVIIDELPAKQLIKNKTALAALPVYWPCDPADPESEDELAFDEYAIAVTKGQTEILNAINEVLDSLLIEDEFGVNGVQKLVNKHLGIVE